MKPTTNLAPILVMALLIPSFLAACTVRTPTAQGQKVDTTALQDQVAIVWAGGARQDLPAPQSASLAVGDGVDVNEVGRAILRFSDLLAVDVVRKGALQVRVVDVDQQSAIVSVLQSAGAALYEYNPETQAKKRLDVDTGVAVIVANGTQFLVVREADTPLDWVLAFDAAPNDLSVTAAGVTQPVTSGVARWVAPVDGPSQAIVFDAEQVVQWVRRARAGQAAPEIGEVLWPQADVIANTTPLTALPAPGTPFFLEGVQLMLDPEGISGNPQYALRDCNGDGVRDLAMLGGRLHMDFRPVLNRVRALDVTVINTAYPGTASVTVLNPNRQVMSTRQVETSDAVDVISLRSEPGRPYHYAQLDMRAGCFLGFSLTPPTTDGQPGEPRPAVTSDELQPQQPTPTPTQPQPQPTATPTRRPTATPTPWPRECTVVADTLNVRAGPGSVYDIVGRLAQGARLTPLARNAESSWLYVQPPRGAAAGWVAADRKYLSCNFDLRTLPERRPPSTPTPTSTPTPPPVRVLFEPQRVEIAPGQCVDLRWEVDNARAVYLDGQGVAGYGSQRVCPQQTTTYRLAVRGYRQNIERTATVVVTQPREPEVSFRTERLDTSCWLLRWDVEYARAVYLDGDGVTGHDQRRMCPAQTTRYTLRVVTLAGQDRYYYQTISVGAPQRQAPVQISPPDGSVFDRYPRTTTLRWQSVPDAYFYRVEIDCYHCCASGAWCTEVGQTWQIENASDTEFTFDFVGAQPGRWRVWAVYLDYSEGPKSGWWTFEYLR